MEVKHISGGLVQIDSGGKNLNHTSIIIQTYHMLIEMSVQNLDVMLPLKNLCLDHLLTLMP